MLVECLLVTLKQNEAATAASTAEPFLRNMSVPKTYDRELYNAEDNRAHLQPSLVSLTNFRTHRRA